MKHKNASVIIAWANGEVVQFKTDDDWTDYNNYTCPNWNDLSIEWRIKPTIIKYRLALMFDKNYGHYITAENTELDRSTLQSHSFVRWISDWIEVEV